MSLSALRPALVSRRVALSQLAIGVGGIGLAAVLGKEGFAAEASPLLAANSAPVAPHHAPRAKSLIFLNMQGGPSQFETFDFKPAMDHYAGKAIPQELSVRFPGKILPSAFRFSRHGQSGLEISNSLPHLGTVADELCVIKSMVCDSQAHPSGQVQALTGYARGAMPCLGSWILYGLGSANDNLPGFVYLANGYSHGSAFLPAETQGMPIGQKLPNVRRAAGMTEPQQREMLDLLAKVNRQYAAEHPADDVLNARIEAAELAFRMQVASPEAVDLTQESQATLDLYGITDNDGLGSKTKKGGRGLSETRQDFGSMCLIARRLVERGVRVVTICVGGRRGWDQHSNLKEALEQNCLVIDQPMAALLKDLKSHGLLDSTLVMWGGEFGRTPYAQNDNGRDHFHKGYTYWLAGGGVKGGLSYGTTHELGLDVAENKVHVHDLHATLLWQLGLDPERLTFRYGGRDQRLTDTSGKVVRAILT
ncbi:MAG: DUF1501 domain-containing protein [Pirellulaceae bacterium]|nr:DUF1501 domain-containing protein [Pirellulaceae bacterium]